MPLLYRRKETEEGLKGQKVPPDVEEKIKRGREAMLKDANLRELCVRFWRGDQNSYLGSTGTLLRLAEVTTSTGGKPPHRIRNKYPFIHSVVEGKVSAATQRVPSYEVIQSTSDHRDYSAARFAEKVAAYLYDAIGVRRATTKCVTNALVQREGFALPYFDPNVGPFAETYTCPDCGKPREPLGECPSCGSVSDPKTEVIGMGEAKILTLTRSEVMWEPDQDFEESRWHAIEREMLPEEVEQMPGYVGGKLKPDSGSEKVVVTTYMERPCSKYMDGRRLVIANGHVICPEEQHPLVDYKGEVVDRPALHRLSYTVDPEGDDRGLVEHLIDLQRTINDCWSKLLEWKNRCLMPQMIAPLGSSMARRDDTPGATWYFNPASGLKPEWERPPAVPTELFNMLDLAISHMRAIAADVDVQPEPDLAAKTATAAIEQARLRWQSFLGDLAEFHSRLMRDLLTLVQRHYSEARQVEIRGQYAWEAVPNFRGQDLRSQVNVRVRPDSLESKGRQRVLEELSFMQANYPNSISAEAAWSALQGGNGEGLLKSYDLDIEAAWRLVELLKQGPDVVLNMPNRFDHSLGMDVPGWMPRKQYNLVIFKQVLGDYFKTPDFEAQPPEAQAIFELVWDGLEWLEQMRVLKLQAQTMDAAAQQGLGNAGKPQSPPPLPSMPGLTPQQADPSAPGPG